MSSFRTDDAEMFHRSLGGFGKRGQGEGQKADGSHPRNPDEQFKFDEAEDTPHPASNVYGALGYIPPPITMTDDLSAFARDIRLMPGTLSTRFQQELLDVLPKWMPARHLFIKRLWQTLFVWSVKRWEESLNPPKPRGKTPMPPSLISMERLSEAISQNGSPNADTKAQEGGTSPAVSALEN